MILNTKYTFLGTPEFAAIILEKLIEANLKPEAVVCNPDKPVGRKQIITPPAVKVLAQKHGLAIYQPKDKSELLEILKKLQPDLAVVAAYGMIFPKEILEIPKYGLINVHPSLLPKYRGPTPIQTAILNGDEKTGASLFLIDEKMDHGPILAQRELELLNTNYLLLSTRLAELGADLLIETLPKYINGEITPLPQDESQATYTKKFSTQDAYVDLEKDNQIEIERKIRALNPEPGAWTIWQGGKPFDAAQGKRTKLLEAQITDGKIKLTKIQVEGKKPTSL